MGNSSWEPELGESFYINDAVEDPRIIMITPTKEKEGELRKGFRVSAVVHQMFMLQSFPFDVQTINIQFRMSCVHKVEIAKVISDESLCDWQGGGGVVMGAWDYVDMKSEVIERAPGEVNVKPDYVVCVTVARKPSFYITNIAMPTIMLVILNFACFLVNHEDRADRMSIVLTILLTCVAFKFSVASLLPILNYETRLDRLTLAMLAIVFVSGVEAMIVSKVSDNIANIIDWATAITSAVLVLLFTGWFLGGSCCRSSSQKFTPLTTSD